MNIIGMANRVKEVLEEFEISEADARIHFDGKKVKARVGRYQLTTDQCVGVVNTSGESFTAKKYLRTMDASPYGASLELSTRKEHRTEYDFDVVLRIEGWLVEGKAKGLDE